MLCLLLSGNLQPSVFVLYSCSCGYFTLLCLCPLAICTVHHVHSTVFTEGYFNNYCHWWCASVYVCQLPVEKEKLSLSPLCLSSLSISSFLHSRTERLISLYREFLSPSWHTQLTPWGENERLSFNNHLGVSWLKQEVLNTLYNTPVTPPPPTDRSETQLLPQESCFGCRFATVQALSIIYPVTIESKTKMPVLCTTDMNYIWLPPKTFILKLKCLHLIVPEVCSSWRCYNNLGTNLVLFL